MDDSLHHPLQTYSCPCRSLSSSCARDEHRYEDLHCHWQSSKILYRDRWAVEELFRNTGSKRDCVAQSSAGVRIHQYHPRVRSKGQIIENKQTQSNNNIAYAYLLTGRIVVSYLILTRFLYKNYYENDGSQGRIRGILTFQPLGAVLKYGNYRGKKRQQPPVDGPESICNVLGTR